MDAPLGALTPPELDGWTPVRVYGGREPAIEWAIVERPFREPFFEQTADVALRRPFNAAFARRTPLAILDELDPGAVPPPAGFVFHLSRCGSTLVARMLGRLASAEVLSEPQPVDALLRLHLSGRTGDEATFDRRLPALVAAMGGGGCSFVKFHAWHVLELPRIARAFPTVPWVFVFREPRAVLRSQEREPGTEVLAGSIDPRYAGLDPANALAEPTLAYAGRMLRAFADAALRAPDADRALFVDYADLPHAVADRILPHFGVVPDVAERAAMDETALADAKRPDERFTETASPRPEPALDAVAAEWLDPAYASLVRCAAAAR